LSVPTVLAVDDELDVLLLVSRVLRDAGYDVVQARHGEEAWDRIQRGDTPPDLLLADVVMPRMTGTELAARVALRHPEIPIVLMSAYSRDDLRQRGLQLAHGHLLTKPFANAELLGMVDRLLRRSGGSGST
jgi:chemosensory pili system protein ChpA (sensor histidine kinase/response regulator)